MKPTVPMVLAGPLLPSAAASQAPELADPSYLLDFIRLQDSAVAAEEAAGCAANPAEAKTALHKKYDLQLLNIIHRLQDRYSDEQLEQAEAQVHAEHKRTPLACPMTDEAIASTEQAYAQALASLEAQTSKGPQQP